jgi:hypothetical protein
MGCRLPSEAEARETEGLKGVGVVLHMSLRVLTQLSLGGLVERSVKRDGHAASRRRLASGRSRGAVAKDMQVDVDIRALEQPVPNQSRSRTGWT